MADVPSAGAAGSNLPAPSGSGVQFELLATLDLFGLRADATALFGPGRDAVLAVRLGDMRLGDLLVFLVDKAAPGSNFQLTPPWDFLNAVNLHDFTFEVDLTRFRIGFRYDGIGFNVPLITLSAVQVFYSPATADRPKSVDLSLFGSFLGVDYTSDPGLTWDLLTEPAPSVPGQGNKVFDLEYLGLGQHVALRRPEALTTIGAVIDALEGAHRTVDRRKNPLSQLPALTFDATAGWFFATKFSALETVTLSAVFNDPVLYGLRVALDGKRVGKLAGLEFEILYRKISDSLGVFHTELKLPDAVRTIEAGEATITLPIIDIDVYTNGNFLVDLGFPRNLDFSRALSVDVIVFVPVPIPVSAAVGLYFGVLSGATSSQVPQVVNGRFDPVIVAGIGVRVGLGYAISLGPLHADFFAGVVGILEGVLAWFHPDADPTSTSIYYRISGTVGIQIHIEGRIDFAILSASLDIEAYADASAVVESYQPIHLTFEAGVSISLSVKVLFFHITLSFSATVRESITIGSATPTPWMLGAPQTGAPIARAAAFADVAALGISWHDRAELVSPVAAGGLVVEVHLQPMLTAGLVGDRPGEEPTGAVAPQVVAALFVADHGQMEGALAVANRAAIIGLAGGPGVDASDAELAAFGMDNAGVVGLLQAGTLLAVPDATVTADGGPLVVGPRDTFATLARRLLSPFERLAREALLWAVESADLSLRAAADDPAVAPLDADSPVSAEHLRALHVDLTTRQLPLARVVDFLTTRGVVLDVRPLPAASPRNPSFTVFPMPPFVSMTVDGATVDFSSGPYLVDADYRALLATYFQDLAGGAAPRPLAPDGGPDESMAAVLFAECFALLLRQLVQDALDQFRLYPYTAAPGESLDEIADRFALTTAGPGADATASDAAVVRIGRANQTSEAFFAPGARLAIRDRSARVAAGDTLLALAARLGTSPLTVARAVRDRAGVLDVGSVLTIAGGHVTVLGTDTLEGIAARLAAPIDVVVGAAADVSLLLAPLTVIPLPTGPYLVSPGDTLGGIARRYELSLAEVGQAAAAVDGLLVVGSGFALPPLPYAVGAAAGSSDAESLAAVVARFETTLGELVGANVDAQALRPGAVVALGLATQVRGGDSLGSLAARFGLAPADLVRAVDDGPGLLVAGATVVLPSGAIGTVAPNDTLAAVAGRAGLAERGSGRRRREPRRREPADAAGRDSAPRVHLRGGGGGHAAVGRPPLRAHRRPARAGQPRRRVRHGRRPRRATAAARRARREARPGGSVRRVSGHARPLPAARAAAACARRDHGRDAARPGRVAALPALRPHRAAGHAPVDAACRLRDHPVGRSRGPPGDHVRQCRHPERAALRRGPRHARRDRHAARAAPADRRDTAGGGPLPDDRRRPPAVRAGQAGAVADTVSAAAHARPGRARAGCRAALSLPVPGRAARPGRGDRGPRPGSRSPGRPGERAGGRADVASGPAADHRVRLGHPDRLRGAPRPRPHSTGRVPPHRVRGVRHGRGRR